MQLFDTKEAGKKLGVSERRVRALCEAGRFGTQVAGRWVISKVELRTFKCRPTGRPKKSGKVVRRTT